MVEMVFMGVGNKVFWDIVFSEEVINDCIINCVLKCWEVWFWVFIVVVLLDYDSFYLGVLNFFFGDFVFCFVLGFFNLYLYRDLVFLGFYCFWYVFNFLEEVVLEIEVELGG